MNSAPGIQFEDLTPRHEAGLSELFRALSANGDGQFFYPHPLTPEESHRLCRHKGLDQYFVATFKNQVLGYAMLRGWDEGYAIPSLGLATHPEHRSKGLAEVLVIELIRRARNQEASHLRLTVDATRDRFMNFFRRYGFVFSPLSPGRMLGMLDLPKQTSPGSPRVGLCADGLIGWGGGVDLVVHQLRSLRAAKPDAWICLLVPGLSPATPKIVWKSVRYAIKDKIKALLGRPRLKQNPLDAQAVQVAGLVGRMREIDPTLVIRYSAGLGEGLARVAADLRLDVVLMASGPPKPRPTCALIGYVPDYQHRRMPHLFPKKEIDRRNDMFDRLIGMSDGMVMNARSVADDMRYFSKKTLPALHALPFSPNLNPEWLNSRPELLSVHSVNGPYFIVCNQFWMHKDHLTAFRAMAEVARHHPEASLVCTGDTTDYRDPTYFGKLEAEAAKLGLGSRLRILGHIPKRDQIELLKNAVALVQPTLFEGGPGGGSTYEAVALGQRVLLSDVPVNREADDGDVRFFPAGDYLALSKLMLVALEEVPVRHSRSELSSRSLARLRRNGEAVWGAVDAAITSRKVRHHSP